MNALWLKVAALCGGALLAVGCGEKPAKAPAALPSGISCDKSSGPIGRCTDSENGVVCYLGMYAVACVQQCGARVSMTGLEVAP